MRKFGISGGVHSTSQRDLVGGEDGWALVWYASVTLILVGGHKYTRVGLDPDGMGGSISSSGFSVSRGDDEVFCGKLLMSLMHVRVLIFAGVHCVFCYQVPLSPFHLGQAVVLQALVSCVRCSFGGSDEDSINSCILLPLLRGSVSG